MIVVTGAAGFIGSCLVEKLNQQGHQDLWLVDDFSSEKKMANYKDKQFKAKIDRSELFSFLDENPNKVDFVFHLGARTDTTEFDQSIFDELNLNYSITLFQYCTENNIPFVYASSAATYGSGEFGYDDDTTLINQLQPLNPYGESKNEFDKWLLNQERTPPFYAGLKFFNVYGPNEYHKGRMASVILHAFRQIKETEAMKLFRSHNSDFRDGEQMRDFVYVKDVVNVLYFLFQNAENKESGIFNLGSGTARTFLDLVKAVFEALNKEPQIGFIDTPEDIRDTYQYFTEAKMKRLTDLGYTTPFTSLEEGVQEYVAEYLMQDKYY